MPKWDGPLECPPSLPSGHRHRHSQHYACRSLHKLLPQLPVTGDRLRPLVHPSSASCRAVNECHARKVEVQFESLEQIDMTTGGAVSSRRIHHLPAPRQISKSYPRITQMIRLGCRSNASISSATPVLCSQPLQPNNPRGPWVSTSASDPLVLPPRHKSELCLQTLVECRTDTMHAYEAGNFRLTAQ